MLRNITFININRLPINRISTRTFFNCSNNHDNYDKHDKDSNGKLVFGGSLGSKTHLKHWNWPEMATYEVSYETYSKTLELEKKIYDMNKKLDTITKILERVYEKP